MTQKNGDSYLCQQFESKVVKLDKDSKMPPSSCPEDEYWEVLITHEAGHAVAAAHCWGVVSYIRARKVATSACPFGFEASYVIAYKSDPELNEGTDMLAAVIVFAAGAQAEKVCLGIGQSNGFKSDLRKIEVACRRAKFLGVEEHQAVESEIASGYSKTMELIEKNRDLVDRIASEARLSLSAMHSGGELLDGATILSKGAIESILAGSCKVANR